MAEGPWYCTCQRAGPLVKECRAIRPRLARTDSREDRRDKNEIIRSPHSAVCRSQAARARRFNEGRPFDWITCVEGLHGDHRYHIHMVLRYSDFPPAVVRHLWRAGEVDDEPVLMPTGGYRRLAEYLTKERTDGIIIPIGRRPWNCSRSLSQQLPPPERWRDESGVIDIPDDVLWARRGERSNSFGAYAYASYIQSNSSFNLSRAPACAPARIRS